MVAILTPLLGLVHFVPFVVAKRSIQFGIQNQLKLEPLDECPKLDFKPPNMQSWVLATVPPLDEDTGRYDYNFTLSGFSSAIGSSKGEMYGKKPHCRLTGTFDTSNSDKGDGVTFEFWDEAGYLKLCGSQQGLVVDCKNPKSTCK